MDRAKYNVVMMAVSFMVLFFAYNTVQNYATSVFPGNLGFQSLGIVYASIAVMAPMAPAINQRIGERKGMILGSFFYVVYLASLIHIVPGVVLFTSFLIGSGAAVLWTSQGSMLALCSPKGQRGRYAGMFWGVFQFSNVGGNGSAYFIFEHGSSYLFVVLTIVAALGFCLLFLVRDPPCKVKVVSEPPTVSSGYQGLDASVSSSSTARTPTGPAVGSPSLGSASPSMLDPFAVRLMGGPKLHQEDTDTAERQLLNASSESSDMHSVNLASPPRSPYTSNGTDSATAHVAKATPEDIDDDDDEDELPPVVSPYQMTVQMLQLFRRKDVLLLLPISFLCGFELAFWSGEFPKLLEHKVIGLVLMFAGIGELTGSAFLGWLADTAAGRSWTMVVTAAIFGVGVLCTVFIKEHTVSLSPELAGAPYLAFIAALCFGVGDAGFNSIAYAQLGHTFAVHKEKHLTAAGFAIYQFFKAMGGAIGYYYSPSVPMHGDDGTLTQVWLQVTVVGLSCVCLIIADKHTPPTAKV